MEETWGWMKAWAERRLEEGQGKRASAKACWPDCWVWVEKRAAWEPDQTGLVMSWAVAPEPATSRDQPSAEKEEASKPLVKRGVEVEAGVGERVGVAVGRGVLVRVGVVVAVGVRVAVVAAVGVRVAVAVGTGVDVADVLALARETWSAMMLPALVPQLPGPKPTARKAGRSVLEPVEVSVME